MKAKRKVAVISVHPDDETLGAGGTLLKHKSNGDEVYWIIITGISNETGHSKTVIKKRRTEIQKVSDMYDFNGVFELNYPTMSLTDKSLLTLIPRLSELFLAIQPEVVYTVNRSDAHSDHRVAFDAVAACTKTFRYPFIKLVLMYECISETEFAPTLPEKAFLPNYYVDISFFLQKKLKVMEVFTSEIGKHPFPRSLRNIEALAVFRGASAGVEYAEAFQLIRFIDK